MDLQGRVAIVTGASSGIGAATARALADEGCRVALVAAGRTGSRPSRRKSRRRRSWRRST